MFMDSFRDGWFSSLSRSDRADLVAHWERLPDDCLRRRFLRPMARHDLEAHAARALGPGAEVIGWYRDGVLRGVAELHMDTNGSEAAFSVEPDYRCQGIGQALMSHVLRRARNRGCRALVIMTTRDNMPMIQIARKAGARLEYEGTEVIGVFRLERATFGTHLADMAEEEAAVFPDLVSHLGRMAAAWLPGPRRRSA